MYARRKAISNCRETLSGHGVDYRNIPVLGVGKGVDTTPFSAFCNDYFYFGGVVNKESFEGYDQVFDLAVSFDTLCVSPDPLLFGRCLIHSVRLHGHVYISSVFNKGYESGDLWRFTPEGLAMCLRTPYTEIIDSFWETDGLGVAVLARRVG